MTSPSTSRSSTAGAPPLGRGRPAPSQRPWPRRTASNPQPGPRDDQCQWDTMVLWCFMWCLMYFDVWNMFYMQFEIFFSGILWWWYGETPWFYPSELRWRSQHLLCHAAAGAAWWLMTAMLSIRLGNQDPWRVCTCKTSADQGNKAGFTKTCQQRNCTLSNSSQQQLHLANIRWIRRWNESDVFKTTVKQKRMHCLLATLQVARQQGGKCQGPNLVAVLVSIEKSHKNTVPSTQTESLIIFAHRVLRVILWGRVLLLPVYLHLVPWKAFSGKFRSAISTVGSLSPFTISARQSANSLRARPKGAPGTCLGRDVGATALPRCLIWSKSAVAHTHTWMYYPVPLTPPSTYIVVVSIRSKNIAQKDVVHFFYNMMFQNYINTVSGKVEKQTRHNPKTGSWELDMFFAVLILNIISYRLSKKEKTCWHEPRGSPTRHPCPGNKHACPHLMMH